jgi:hypothetical protein
MNGNVSLFVFMLLFAPFAASRPAKPFASPTIILAGTGAVNCCELF